MLALSQFFTIFLQEGAYSRHGFSLTMNMFPKHFGVRLSVLFKYYRTQFTPMYTYYIGHGYGNLSDLV